MQAITGDSVVLKFEKAKSSLTDSLRRVEDIVEQSIGSQVVRSPSSHFLVRLFCIHLLLSLQVERKLKRYH